MSKIGENMRDIAAARVARQKNWNAELEAEKSRILKQNKPVNEILVDLVIHAQGGTVEISNNTSDTPNEINNVKLQEVDKPKGPKKLSKRSKTITVIRDNPRRPSSDAWKRYELYSSCATVAEYLAAGGTSMDVHKDKKAGNIRVN